MTSVAALLAGCGLSRLESRLLLAHVLGTPTETLIAHPELAVDDAAAARFGDLAARRAQGEPIAYLLGEKEFYGRPFRVSPAVLIPRPETELLAQLALDRLRELRAPRVLDLGTGSGCLAVTLALECPTVTVTAADRSVEALAVARANAERLGARVECVRSDWFEGIEGVFDAIVANPPYVATGDCHLPALRHEPRSALVAGADGLDELRRIVAGAPAHLSPGGWLAVEHGYDQGPAVRELFLRAGFNDAQTHRDFAGVERACSGTWGGAQSRVRAPGSD